MDIDNLFVSIDKKVLNLESELCAKYAKYAAIRTFYRRFLSTQLRRDDVLI